MKVHPVGADLFHADGQTYRQTDMMKLVVAFHNFANTPKNQSVYVMFFFPPNAPTCPRGLRGLPS